MTTVSVHSPSIWEDFWILTPCARYGGFKGCGILLHAQLSYWGPGTQLWKTLFFEFVMYIAYMGGLLLQSQVLQPGATSGGSESWKMRCFNRVLPPAGQNPEKRVWGMVKGPPVWITASAVRLASVGYTPGEVACSWRSAARGSGHDAIAE